MVRSYTMITGNQFGVMSGRSTTESIFYVFYVRRIVGKYRGKKNKLRMIFIDLEKERDILK